MSDSESSEEAHAGNAKCVNVSSLNIKLRQRQQIVNRITTLKENMSQLSGMSAYQIDAKLAVIDRHFDGFEKLQAEIEILDESQIEGNHRNIFEDSYFEVKAYLVEKLAASKRNETEGTLSSTHIAPPTTSSHHRMNLPKLQLTKFSGLHRDWLDFYNMFLVLVHNNTELSDIEKFQYLRTCLSEKPSRLIESLEVTGVNYHKAIELLTVRYDNKRYIFQSHLHHIFEIQIITKSSVSALRELVDTVNANLRAMQSFASRIQIADGILLHLVTSKLDQETQAKWEEEIASKFDSSNSTSNKLPAWEDLATFLERRCQTFDIIEEKRLSLKQQPSSSRSSSSFNTRSSSRSHTNKPQMSLVATSQPPARCEFCNKTPSHNPFHCPKFQELDPYERQSLARRLKLCFNCLRPNHMTSMCPSSRRCQHCKVSHHTLLHRGSTNMDSLLPSSDRATTNNQPEPTASSSTALQVSQLKSEVILGTALVQLSTGNGVTIIARALLDSASQLHFLTERMAQYLHLKRKKHNIEINGIGLNNTNAHQICSVEIKSLHNAYSSTIDAVIMPSITSYQPHHQFDINLWGIPQNIKLADATFNEPGNIDLLIGAGLFYQLLSVGQIIIHETLPLLQKTKLGWIVSGTVSSQPLNMPSLKSSSPSNILSSPSQPPTSLFVEHNTLTAQQELNTESLLVKFWEIENHQKLISSKLSLEEEECERFFARTTKRCPVSNKYIVRLPFKEDPRSIGQSYDIALKRLVSLEHKINQNSALFKDYSDFIEEYRQLGHMTLIPQNEAVTSFFNYIPHHCVIRRDSSTTKLRVVFDASCRTANGKSLNDTLRIGPTLQDDIFTILNRFRTHKYVLMADITKMFRQIKVDEDDAKWQCILWRDKKTNSVLTFRLDTVTYGTRCAPYLAQKCIQQVALDEANSFPIGSAATLRDFYVDNLMTGGSTIEEVIEIRNQVTALLRRGGFPLRKFASNNNQIIADIQPSDREEIMQVEDYEYVKALGLKWSPSDDNFLFDYSHQPKSSKFTKRSILSHICSFFDPLGLLNPIIVTCKILMQSLWKLKLHWDESVPQDVHLQWQNFRRQLTLISKIRIPRFVPFDINTELHAFSDASMKAYGACVYAVSRRPGYTSSVLLCAKSRVAPTREISLPRLELCAALLLSELLQSLVELLAPKPENVYCWSDSTITLAWISGESSRWTIFVSNRVSKIQQLTSKYTWNHVQSENNPADLVSRGTNVSALVENSLWFTGPEFLQLGKPFWPSFAVSTAENLPEQRRTRVAMVSTNAPDVIFNHKFINNYDKLLRVFSYVRRFITLSTKVDIEVEKDRFQLKR